MSAGQPSAPRRYRLGIIATHPVQYAVPWFRRLAAHPSFDPRVLFLREPTPLEQGAGFAHSFIWDTELREGFANDVLRIHSGLAGVWRLARVLPGHLCAMRPDALLVTGWNDAGLIVAALIGKAMRIPVIMRGDSTDLRKRSLLVRTAQYMYLKIVDAAVVTGSANYRFYLGRGVDAEKLFLAPHFVDNDFLIRMWQERKGARHELRSAMGFDERDVVFAFVGKHSAVKRPEVLVHAAARLRDRGIPVALLFAGAGELTEMLRRLVETLGIKSHFTGFLNQTELWRAYIPADSFVLCSFSETWGLVVNEALLFALPVVVTSNAGCCEDLVIDGITGFVPPDDSVDALATAMERLCRNRVAAKAGATLGQYRVAREFHMDVSTASLLKALSSIVSTRRGANA
jgi:glycosyltransferase involved in cell wall biosynthesis